MALKVPDVPGDRLEGSEDQSSQDFVMVNGLQFNSPNAKAFLRSLKLLAKTTDRAERSKALASAFLRGTERTLEAVGGQSAKLEAMGGEPAHHAWATPFSPSCRCALAPTWPSSSWGRCRPSCWR